MMALHTNEGHVCHEGAFCSGSRKTKTMTLSRNFGSNDSAFKVSESSGESKL